MEKAATVIKVALASMVIMSTTMIVMEIEKFYDDSRDSGSAGRDRLDTTNSLGRSVPHHVDDLLVAAGPNLHLPNEGRLKWEDGVFISEMRDDVGPLSVHNGSHQRERQEWLKARAEDIRKEAQSRGSSRSGGKSRVSRKNRVIRAEITESPSSSASTAAAAAAARRKTLASADARVDIESKIEGMVETITPRPPPPTRRAPAAPEREAARSFTQGDRTTKNNADGKGGGSAAAAAAAGSDKKDNRPVPPQRKGNPGKRKPKTPAGPVTADGSDAVKLPLKERLLRLETGAELWGATFVPPIAPGEKRELIERWTAPATGGEVGNSTASATKQGGGNSTTTAGAPRILFVVTSFDRGSRLRQLASKIDKLDYLLMIMDEIRETCEAGFSPHIHLISAWDAQPEFELFSDRLFCRRIGRPVSLTSARYPPSIQEVLSIKHRIYMKPRMRDYDLFIQLEDDMILTVNHILRYLEESEKLALRGGEDSQPRRSIMPGFLRVEPEPGVEGVGGDWFEWEIILSRFRGVHVAGAGTYLALERSRVMPYAGNNQGFWMATQGQLDFLDRTCNYLKYTEASDMPFVEKYSGSLEMFSPTCRNTKVFPATHFEDFMVHHRTNNKNGKRGESKPAVSISMLRLWASQMLRDDEMLMEME